MNTILQLGPEKLKALKTAFLALWGQRRAYLTKNSIYKKMRGAGFEGRDIHALLASLIESGEIEETKRQGMTCYRPASRVPKYTAALRVLQDSRHPLHIHQIAWHAQKQSAVAIDGSVMDHLVKISKVERNRAGRYALVQEQQIDPSRHESGISKTLREYFGDGRLFTQNDVVTAVGMPRKFNASVLAAFRDSVNRGEVVQVDQKYHVAHVTKAPDAVKDLRAARDHYLGVNPDPDGATLKALKTIKGDLAFVLEALPNVTPDAHGQILQLARDVHRLTEDVFGALEDLTDEIREKAIA
jgi:hypothetical protein